MREFECAVDRGRLEPARSPEHEQVVEQVRGLAHERVFAFGDGRQRRLDAFFAQLLGDLECALREELRRVRGFGIGAFARPDHLEEPVDGMGLSHRQF